MKRTLSHLTCATALAAALLATNTAQAAPVHYDEAVDGDLASVPLAAATTFVLGAGVNTIKGTFGGAVGVPMDFDSFAIVFFSGLQLMSLSVELDDAVGNITSTAWALRSGFLVAGGQLRETIEVTSPGMADAVNPIAPGTYHLYHNLIELILPRPALANYTFSITMAPAGVVPLPGTLPLAALALSGLVLGARRAGRKSDR